MINNVESAKHPNVRQSRITNKTYSPTRRGQSGAGGA